MFDMYFASSSYKEVNELAKKLGSCKLFTNYDEREEIIEWAEGKIKGTLQNKLFVDSGAYTAHRQGVSVDVDDYIAFVNEYDDGIDLIAQVDKIPGRFREPRTIEDIKNAPIESWDNYLYMRDKLKSPDKLMPIFHQDEDFRWLENMLNWTDSNGHHIPYIGISSAKDKGYNIRENWHWKVFSIIQKSANPKVKTHAFGNSSLRQLEMFPFASAASNSWVYYSAYGHILSDYGVHSVSEGREGNREHISTCPISEKKLIDIVKGYGFEMNDLMYGTAEYKATLIRRMYNLTYLTDWGKRYQYKGPENFIMRGLW